MKLNRVKVNNYRTLDGLEIKLHDSCNFLVGENNLGKSNFLDLLYTIFSEYKFRETDFQDENNPIFIEITFALNDVEIGILRDLFDPLDDSKLNLIVEQASPDDNIVFVHKETNQNIPASEARCLNYIGYDSLRNPSNELSFTGKKGVAAFLNFLVNNYLETNSLINTSFLKEVELEKLITYLNGKLNKVKPLKDFSIKAMIDPEPQNILTKLVLLCDSNKLSLTEVGCSGVQFSALIILSILERILRINKSKLKKNILDDGNGKKHIPVVLGVDEPEIHLHPFMQRTLIKYLIRIIDNKEADFLELLKHCFDIDGFIGQIIMVTHSPHMILNDYKQIIRLHKDATGKLTVKNGSQIALTHGQEKHLLMNMHYIKEAFFARGVIVVEGETEFGALPLFSERMSVDFDNKGISVIKAGGAESIPVIMELLDKFGISTVGIVDKDQCELKPDKYNGIPNLFITSKWDFEEELVQHLLTKDDLAPLQKILLDYDSRGTERTINQNKLQQTLNDYGYAWPRAVSDTKFSEATDATEMAILYLAWMDINKGAILGRTIGSILAEDEIPEVYKQAIIKIRDLVACYDA